MIRWPPRKICSGMRFHGTRGSMSIGESQGGLPPDYLTEAEPAILADSQRLIETHHDAHRFAMTRVALAPCSPFSVSMDLMRETAKNGAQLWRGFAHTSC